MLLLLHILPELPHWLLLHDQREKTQEIAQKLHQHTSDDDNVCTIFALMVNQAEHDKRMESSWEALFLHLSCPQRAIIVMLIGIFDQAPGVTAINNFSPFIYSTLGLDLEENLILLYGWITGGIFASLIGQW